MGNWFGNLDLAYKYTVVFISLLLLTILAGLVKVFFDRRKLKKLAAKQNEDGEVREERMELTGREKDEGDYFGVRALEAGFYAGVAQSAPTSRANSVVGSPFMSTSTLVGGGGVGNLKDSKNNSVTTLPLAHTRERNNSAIRDSDTLPSPQSEDPPRRRSPPAIRLAPSTAELTGRHRFSAAVNMNLNVPPSPSASRGPSSPTFGGSDNGESDGALSPRSQMSPTSPVTHYAPNPPQLPMPQPDGFRASFVSVYDHYQSQTASMLMASPTGTDAPADASMAMPGITLNDSDALPKSPVQLLPKTYQPSHNRDNSDSSSIYSEARHSKVERDASRQSTIGPLPVNGENRKTLLPPAAGDNRYSDIYDAYYRHSMIQGSSSVTDSSRSDDEHPAGSKAGAGMAM
ncbi:hypothetical protein DPSP01_008383 [Paraphaeosphaeria sporulosa]|uniref:Uncharacterized protein n=1 Tax=Paraphaeosphaeria sporulosa TaxID=1460663 RepID=A0A177CAV1_9PLEO|nr:uncharacterized protein CC84DRAFT_1217773 [Paraphaeosphaeria sporulosa]OAG04301.1 hypothetical protein CC84DRAFT_1217773 [Paraphaeosphaeria sporulosa]